MYTFKLATIYIYIREQRVRRTHKANDGIDVFAFESPCPQPTARCCPPRRSATQCVAAAARLRLPATAMHATPTRARSGAPRPASAAAPSLTADCLDSIHPPPHAYTSPSSVGPSAGVQKGGGRSVRSRPVHMDDEASARFSVRLAEAAALPMSERVSLSQPLFLFHVPKTSGSSMRTLLSSAVGAHTKLLPCVNCACACDPLADRTRNRSSCAVAVLGHIFPFPTVNGHPSVRLLLLLDRGVYGRPRCRRHWPHDEPAGEEAVWRLLNRSLCVTLLRNPVHRLVSSFYEFIHRKSSNLSLPAYLSAFGPQRLVESAGGGHVYASLLGGGRPDRAARLLSTCVTGIQERYTDFVATLGRLLPMPPPLSAAREHAHPRYGMPDDYDYNGLSRLLLPLMPGETELWEQASAVAAQQHALAAHYAPLAASATIPPPLSAIEATGEGTPIDAAARAAPHARLCGRVACARSALGATAVGTGIGGDIALAAARHLIA